MKSEYVRVQFTDAAGVRRERMRRAATITEARKLKKKLLRELDEHGEQSLDGDNVNFADLARACSKKRS